MNFINIKPNDFVRPTEIRMEIVQKICDHILNYIGDGNEFRDWSIRLKEEHPALYFGELKTPNELLRPTSLVNRYEESGNYNYTRIRSVEMKKVFTELQDAGYHIFYDGYRTYTVSRRPYLDNVLAKRIEFKIFID